MKAIIWTAYGPPDVLKLRDVAPPAPRDNEILVRVRAASVTNGDCELRRLALPLPLSLPLRLYVGLRRPRRIPILGQELAGEVAAVGSGVTPFRAGDAVFAFTGLRLGAYAEYACLRAGGAIAPKPANLSWEEAATLPMGGMEALDFLRRAEIRPGERLLINGAGGSIGTVAVQLGKHYGAEVTAVDSGDKLPMLHATGADHVIDYTREDFTRHGQRYDVIFDVIGKSPFARSMAALAPGGRYLLGNPRWADRARAARAGGDDGKRVLLATDDRGAPALEQLRELVEAGVLRPVIDRRYPLEETAEAHRYVDSGRKQGCVAIRVD